MIKNSKSNQTKPSEVSSNGSDVHCEASLKQTPFCKVPHSHGLSRLASLQSLLDKKVASHNPLDVRGLN